MKYSYQPRYPSHWVDRMIITGSAPPIPTKNEGSSKTNTRKCVVCGKKSTQTIKTQTGHECKECWEILDKYNKK